MMSIKELFTWIVNVLSGKPVDMEPEEVKVDLSDLTKKELVVFAESKGIKLSMRLSKQKMIDTILAS